MPSSLFADRVYETSASTGTGAFVLAGAVTGYQSFNTAFASNSFYYLIVNRSAPAQWEIGQGALSGAGPYTLNRTTILSVGAGYGNPVNFTAGTKDVYNIAPASVMQNWNSAATGGGLNLQQNTMLTCLGLAMSGSWSAGTLANGAYDSFSTDTIGTNSTGHTYSSGSKYYTNLSGVSGTPHTSASVISGYFYTGGVYAGTGATTIDASTTSDWILTNGGGGNVVYGYLFGSGVNIAQLDLYSYNPAYPIKSATIEVSADTTNGTDGTWTSVATGWNPGAGAWASKAFTGGIYKGLRLTSGTTYVGSPPNYYASLGEVKFYPALPGSMTLLTSALSPAPASTPSQLSALVLWKDVSGTAVLNTDFTVEGTCNNGTNWATGTLVDTGMQVNGFNVLLASIALTGTGTTVKVRLKALSKTQQVKGLAYITL